MWTRTAGHHKPRTPGSQSPFTPPAPHAARRPVGTPARCQRRPCPGWQEVGQAELRLQPPALFPASVHGRLTQPPSFAPCSPCLRAVCVGMLAHPGPCAPQRERRREGTATRDWPLPRGGAGLPRSAPSRCKVLPRAHAPNAPPRATVPRQSRREGPVRRTDPQHWREKEVQAPPGRN